MFRRLTDAIRAWLIGVAVGQLVKVSVEKLGELPWALWGMRLNERMDAKFEKRYADQVQQALAEGMRKLIGALEA